MAINWLHIFCAVRCARLAVYQSVVRTDSMQDPEAGGFGDRPGNMVDVFHTNFAIAGLSLLKFEGVQEVDPV